MHYWLADRAAKQIDSEARALLLDANDLVTECSTANIVLYDQRRGLLSPPQEKILPGISVGMLMDLAGELEIPFSHQPLGVADIAHADEVLLCSTSPCVWPVLRFNGQPIGDGQPGDVFRQLIAAWSEQVGVDIVGQAKQRP
jgi:branched-subunit amino acid aminotransferase/4-amino-4-deoxychorismate lyase